MKLIFSGCGIFILLLILLSGCNKPSLYSNWRSGEVKIDGQYSDFGSSMAYYDEESKVALNLLNDSSYLYICLVTRSRQVEAQIMDSGFVFWFDPQGGQDKVFGLRFPIGMRRMGMPLEKKQRSMDDNWQDQRDISDLVDNPSDVDMDLDKRLMTIEKLQDKIVVMTVACGKMDKNGRKKTRHFKNKSLQSKDNNLTALPDDGHLELSLADARKMGLEAAVGRQNEYFVLEVKVPLVKSAENKFAIGAIIGRPFGFGMQIAGNYGLASSRRPQAGAEDQEEMFDRADNKKFSPDSLKLWSMVILADNKG